MRPILLLVLGLLAPSVVLAQDGGVIVRIPDGVTSSCVTPKHQVFLTLRRLITTRNVGWLREDRSVGLLINAAVLSGDKRVNFPLASQVNVRQYASGQVSIPVEYNVVSGLPLTQDKTTFSGLQLDLTLLNMQARTGWGKALDALVEVSKNLPIPSTPLITASSYLLDFANKAVQKEVDAHNADDKAKSATLAMNFDPTGQCQAGRDWERTGTLAVLQQGGATGPGHVNVMNTNDYCWVADLKPTFALKAARKDPAKSCSAPDYRPTFTPVTNNYVAFFLNALPASRTLGVVDAEQKEAVSRCAAHGLAAAACIPQ
ncbi:MAG TPA: hypothetical protein VIY56_07430 [Vicinamibacterales bacterium]